MNRNLNSLSRNPKPRPTKSERERLDKLTTAFAEEAMEACGHRCANCGYEGPHLEVHHAVSQNTIKRTWQALPLEQLDELLWNPDNGLALCQEPAPQRCHARHELAVARIPRSKLRPENLAFAQAFGFEHVLERFYPEDERTAA